MCVRRRCWKNLRRVRGGWAVGKEEAYETVEVVEAVEDVEAL